MEDGLSIEERRLLVFEVGGAFYRFGMLDSTSCRVGMAD